ncbi:MAG: DUF5131 family protein, partial [Holophagales bacterium]|nr:DUF5131 family protein [Holophagales bacterium]
LSVEPLLEDLGELNLDGIHWVIAGGESGPGARPMQEEWVRNVRDQCARAKVPFYRACERARRAGCIVISAIPFSARPSYPGIFDNVLGVTAGRFANAYDFVHEPYDGVELMAQGERRVPWASGWRAVYGSSFAAPHIAAHVALLRECFPGAGLEVVRRLLEEQARPHGVILEGPGAA